MAKSIGVILLCVFLLLFGLAAVTNFEVVWMSAIIGFCAILAAIFLFLGK